MPRTKTDYSKTVIYKLQHKDIESLVYVGSTTNFIQRKYNHKGSTTNPNHQNYNEEKYKTIRANGGWDMFNMLEIKKYPCNDNREAEAEEQRCIDELKGTLNQISAYVSKEDLQQYQKNYHTTYYKENQQRFLERNRAYLKANPDKYTETYECSCGKVVRKWAKYQHIRTKQHIDAINVQ